MRVVGRGELLEGAASRLLERLGGGVAGQEVLEAAEPLADLLLEARPLDGVGALLHLRDLLVDRVDLFLDVGGVALLEAALPLLCLGALVRAEGLGLAAAVEGVLEPLLGAELPELAEVLLGGLKPLEVGVCLLGLHGVEGLLEVVEAGACLLGGLGLRLALLELGDAERGGLAAVGEVALELCGLLALLVAAEGVELGHAVHGEEQDAE